VKKLPVLKVLVICRRWVSPQETAVMIQQRLRAIDGFLGEHVPVLIQIRDGFRARVTKSTRLR